MNKTGRLPNRAVIALLIVSTICLVASGCSAKGRPLVSFAGGLNYSPDAAGLNELLTKLPALSPADQKQQLKSFCTSGLALPLKQKSSYVLGRILQKGGTPDDLSESVICFKDAAALPALREQCQWHISECGILLGDEKIVRAALKDIVEHSQKPDSRIAAQYGLAQSSLRAGEQANAQEQFQQIKNSKPTSNFALGAEYYLAQMQIAALPPNSPAPESVLAAWRHYLATSPDGRFANDIITQLQKMSGFTPTQNDHNIFADVYYTHGDWHNALDEWHKAGNTNTWYKQALCFSHIGKSNEAQKVLLTAIQEHPGDNSVVTAANMLAKMANREGAIAVWTTVLQHCPKFADIALYNLGTRAATPAASMAIYRRILSTYPTSTHAPEAAWWLAWNDIKSGNSSAALATLQATTTRYPNANGLARYLYWTGKLQEHLGQKAQASATYQKTISSLPWHYYAHRAAARLTVLNGGKDRGWSTSPQRQVSWTHNSVDDWKFPEPPAQLARQEGTTVETLTELQQWDECLQLLTGKHGLLRAFYLAKLDLPLDAINAAGRSLHGQPTASEYWKLAYPLLYARTIGSESMAKQVDPLLVQALIREESRYNVRAMSGSQAIGLMQLMPGTAYGVAKRIGIHLSSAEDIHKPDNNLRMGIDYLSYVLHRFDGNALFAVASYNGGPNAVKRWSQSMPADTDVFVENIPFRETRDYVRKVFGSYWNYEKVYAQRKVGA